MKKTRHRDVARFATFRGGPPTDPLPTGIAEHRRVLFVAEGVIDAAATSAR